MDGAARARLAATVILLRDRPEGGFEVFMVQRSHQASFMPGAFVYPGGQVDLDDGSAAAAAVCAPFDAPGMAARLGRSPELARALLVAGVRECFEEIGVLLARGAALGTQRGRAALARERVRVHRGERRLVQVARDLDLELALDGMRVFAHWITPAAQPKRFDTYFMVTRHPDDQEPLHDAGETIASTWITPSEALERHARIDFPLWPPTFSTLEQLRDYESAAAVIEAAPRLPLPAIEPRMEWVDGTPTMLLPGDPLYPPRSDAAGDGAPTRVAFEEGRWVSRGSRT